MLSHCNSSQDRVPVDETYRTQSLNDLQWLDEDDGRPTNYK